MTNGNLAARVAVTTPKRARTRTRWWGTTTNRRWYERRIAADVFYATTLEEARAKAKARVRHPEYIVHVYLWELPPEDVPQEVRL